jgi:hypothetical protein
LGSNCNRAYKLFKCCIILIPAFRIVVFVHSEFIYLVLFAWTKRHLRSMNYLFSSHDHAAQCVVKAYLSVFMRIAWQH